MTDLTNKNKIWSAFLIVLTTSIIIPAIGIQAKDIHDSVTFGMPVTAIMYNYFFLFVVFPICYFIFIRQTRKVKSNPAKGSIFLIQGIGILIFAFYIVDNSHPEVNMRTEAGLSYYKSETFNFVFIISIINMIIGAFYFVWERVKLAST